MFHLYVRGATAPFLVTAATAFSLATTDMRPPDISCCNAELAGIDNMWETSEYEGTSGMMFYLNKKTLKKKHYVSHLYTNVRNITTSGCIETY